MVSSRGLQLLVLTCLASALPASADGYHLLVTPESPVLEIGTKFVATCVIVNTTEVTADDLFWTVKKNNVPREQYTKINGSALSVTLNITGVESEWLLCHAKAVEPYVLLNKGRFIHGILLNKGYRPGKPENLTCVALQEKKYISPTLSCKWDSVGSQTEAVPTVYTLKVAVISTHATYSVSTSGNSAKVTFDSPFPNYMTLEIWVEAQNKLGKVESEHLKEDANFFVKTNPPSELKVISEKSFPSCLLLNWTRPIPLVYVKLTYQIRYCQNGSHNWSYVPLEDTGTEIQSFRLQGLQPDTVYVAQVCCKNERKDHGYWSDWSTNATKRTPEDRPKSKPDVWRIITAGDSMNERQVKIICKDPVVANGKIKRFDIKIQNQKDKVKNASWESVAVNRSDSSSSQHQITVLKQIPLADRDSVRVFVTAVNSVGNSPKAALTVSEKRYEGFCGPTPAEGLKVWPHEGQLWLQWRPPNGSAVTEYVVQWVSGGETDWQRETNYTRSTAIKGNLQEFVCYRVSVYPIYSGCTGKPAHMEAYLKQDAPEEGPNITVNDKRRNEADLVWTEIPEDKRRGFITNYTIFYTSGRETLDITVPANTTSYTLKSLSANTQYHAWVKASTVRGSATSITHSFATLKYAPGEMESIVVGVCLGFLFIVIITMLLCVYKKDAIKENFWPRIPDPGESTIGNWSPDYPLKAETPKENCLSGISVLDVDVCDGKSVFEEDKASLPLKKDKYLSEEHSSGIGGSSCMSSPRQSVSDSDEGGDLADTTASTVQYSSVVASSGYKGQTPSSQPQQAVFSRSESTQPLLDCEENPDTLLLQDGGRQRYPRITNADVTEPLDFCPLEEDSETPTDGAADWLQSAASASSYMPQLGGYRPQ